MPSESSPGVFATWQPRYADVGIPTFPLEGKIPLIRGYLKVGLRASLALARKFPHAQAFGLRLGRNAGITVLDIDTTDSTALSQAFRQYGSTPFVVRTGSGNYQAWYRHDGERRLIRPFRDVPIDILGAGYVVAPPSQTGIGYEIILGSLEDLRLLPKMKSAGDGAHHEARQSDVLTVGKRNKALFSFALREARHTDDQATLLDVVRHENENACVSPLAEAEVARIVRSAWKYERQGRNFASKSYVFATLDETDALAKKTPDAFALLMILRRQHGGRTPFVLAKAMAASLGWTIPRFRAARSKLEHAGYIRCLHAGGKGRHDPPMYTFA